MSTYRNKKNKCLCVALTFLIAISIVLILAGAQEGIEITFSQNPIGPVSPGEKIDFWWDITKPANYLAGEVYCLEISGPNYREIIWRGHIPRNGNFGNRTSWVVPPAALEDDYTAALKLPCDSPLHISSNIFPVKPTLLVIQKYNDSNRNNNRDPSDERLSEGWLFRIKYPDGTIHDQPTNEYGEIRIGGIPGYYEIEEISNKPFWKPIPPNKSEYVPEGETVITEFLNVYHPHGVLVIRKFNDSNQNQVPDYGEEGLANWEFTVAQDGRTVATCTTNETGFCVHTLQFGIYEITEVGKEGWIATTPTTQVKKVEAGQKTEAKFGNRPTPPVIVSKFYDLNRNGRKDGGETGIADWDFIVTQNGRRVATGRTDSNGMWMPNLPDGEYTIHEREPPSSCWRNSTPTSQEVTVRTGVPRKVEFGNYEFGTLVIYKFNDTDRNGVWDAGEVPLPNWGFTVKGLNGVIDITRYTDENGGSTVELPANLSYSVSETIPVDWRNSTPHTQLVYINPCEDTPAIFGNYRYTPIIIHKFNDTNGNGIRDSDEEEGLAGWDFWISGPNVNEIFTTDENGRVRYEDAIPGQYRIEERIRDDQRRNDWRITTPPRTKEVVVEEGQRVKVEFGNAIICPCDEIYPLPELAPRWHNNSDENLVVSKYVDPRIVHCDNPNPNEGEIINVTLRVSAFAGMPPTDLVIAVDTSGSLLECSSSRAVLEAISEGITEYIANNEAKFGENVRIGLVSWDEDIDEIVNLTTDYSNVTAACKRLSINAEEDTLYPVGLNGSIGVFDRSPRENVTKMIVFITDARGTTDGLSNYSRLPDTSAYIIHAITVCTERDSDNFKMLVNFTSQHSGVVRSVSESSDELAKELTTLTVSSIERRILNNVTVIETLPKYLRVLNWTYRIPPTSPEHINRDGIDWSTETIVWDINDLSSDKCWENTFQAIFCCRMPVDETYLVGVPKKTSEVTYTDPTNSSITKHLLIPEGGIWIQPRPWWERVPVWLWALLGAMAIAIIALAIYCFRRTPKQET